MRTKEGGHATTRLLRRVLGRVLDTSKKELLRRHLESRNQPTPLACALNSLHYSNFCLEFILALHYLYRKEFGWNNFALHYSILTAALRLHLKITLHSKIRKGIDFVMHCATATSKVVFWILNVIIFGRPVISEEKVFIVDLVMGLFRGAVFRHGGGALKQPIKQPIKTPTSTLALMGRFPSSMGRFPTLMGRFTDFVLRGRFTSWKSIGKQPIKKRGVKRFLINGSQCWTCVQASPT